MKSQSSPDVLLPTIRHTPAVSHAWRTRSLSNDAASLLMQIVALSSREGFCWMSNARLAWQSGMVSVPTIKRLLHELSAGKWIDIDISVNASGTFRKLRPNLKKVDATPPPMSIPEHLRGGIKTDPTPGSILNHPPSVGGIKTDPTPGSILNHPRISSEPLIREREEEKGKKTKTVVDRGRRHRVASAALTKERGTTMPSEKPKAPERKQSLKLRSTSKPIVQPEAQATPDDSRFAVILRDAILGAGYQLPRTSPDRPLKHESWISEFRKLRDIDKIAQPRIESVLTAYCQNITDEFAPQAWSGKSFRAKFAAIERFAKIKSADTPATPEDDDLDADALEIEKWNWPTPIRKGDLSQSVQTARTFGTSLWKQCRAMRGEDASFDVFLDSILEQRSEAFTLRWHKWVLASVQNWEAWSGSLKKFAASASHPLFRKWIMRLSKEQTCQDADGKRFLRNMEDVA